tara:strand:- start:317 stop:775 length:459 start_codon:yes stop_codon:yes gene_type:complete
MTKLAYIFCVLLVLLGLFLNDFEINPEFLMSGIPQDVDLLTNTLGEVMTTLVVCGLVYFFIILPLTMAPIRKAIGLVNIILGVILSLSGIGMIFGVPMMFFGAILFFIGGGKPDRASDSNINYIDPEEEISLSGRSGTGFLFSTKGYVITNK